LYRGRVYSTAQPEDEVHESTLALARAGLNPAHASRKNGGGVLVASRGAGYTALSLYRYRAVVKKARRDNARGKRVQFRTTCNMNKMDKKANRMMNGVSVAHAAR